MGKNDTEATPKAKPGRKRKAKTPIEEIDSSVDVGATPEGTSRSGRRRKQINYFDLANPDASSEDGKKKTPKPSPTVAVKVKKTEPPKSAKKPPPPPPKKKARKSSISNGNKRTKSKIVIEEEETNQDSGDTSDSEDSDSAPISKQNVCTTTRKSTNADELEDSAEEITHRSEVSGENDSALPESAENGNPEPGVKKKYNYTGATGKMINTMFTFYKSPADKNSANTSTAIEEDSPPSSSAKKVRRGRWKGVEMNPGDPKTSDTVTCAVCNVVMDRTLWTHHKQKFHNNLAWKVGEAALDLTDQTFVMNTLNALYKKKKPLRCEECGEVKKSVLGFLSHQAQCKKSDMQIEEIKTKCDICGKKMLPVSMVTHMKYVHSDAKKTAAGVSADANALEIPGKRMAAKKAMQVIEKATRDSVNVNMHYTTNLRFTNQEFAINIIDRDIEQNGSTRCRFGRCYFNTDNCEDMIDHLEECPKRPYEGFACKECLHVSTALEEIVYHIEVIHDLKVPVKPPKPVEEKQISRLPTCISHTYWVKKTHRGLFISAFDWTFDFQEKNFSDKLFNSFLSQQSDWLLLPFNDVDQYLPKLGESCDVARFPVTGFLCPLAQEFVFKKYELFESDVHADGKCTIFCGGPISAIAWLPTPHTKLKENQVLAVAVLNSPDEKYKCHENYSTPNAIQFWNFGALENKEKLRTKPKLVFNLAHNHGPVWDMKWCPSGVYDDKESRFSRMGLLAVAGSDPAVHIYAIPYFTDDEEGLYYKARPVLKLLLQRAGSPLLGGLKYYARKISWSKAAGHSYIAVGYTNGFVGMYNLTTKSFILKQKDNTDGVTYILPYKCFQAHSHAVTTVSLHHLNGGGRWLVSGSMDRVTSVWDVENSDYPISSIKKNIVTDGFWLTNWICYVMGQDEGSTNLYVTTNLKQSRDFLCDPSMNLTCSPSTISSIAGSDWLNGILQANTSGELIAIFPQQLLCISDCNKMTRNKRWLFGYTYLVDKKKSPKERFDFDKEKKKLLNKDMKNKSHKGLKLSHGPKANFNSDMFCNEPVVYDQAEDRYGLLFCDNRMESYADFPDLTYGQLSPFSRSFKFITPNQYPMTAANVVEFNPNRQASLYYATGYQAGFLRISWLNFLKDDPQIK